MFDWPFWARDEQLPPDGDWTTWLLMGGRGSGKTRAGAEWIRSLAAAGVTPIAIVGQTIADATAVMVKGESGIMAVHPPGERPLLREQTLRWRNGVEATILSAPSLIAFGGRSLRQPGAMKSASGPMPRRRGTCSSSACASGAGLDNWQRPRRVRPD
ncbi:MAG TPA: terminase family protein [Devosia sp.]|jgi:phage terminase large subunit-like protein|uniref:terminase large subunit domain-containing protein n=1 Tax=Devosia sp. TaxID=1871048 RepID=UPI002F92CC9B